tara:strand:+ start:865 stop:1035 length:171 start_codon:yes stop_codon:yes gene_type:complete
MTKTELIATTAKKRALRNMAEQQKNNSTEPTEIPEEDLKHLMSLLGMADKLANTLR